MIQQSSSIGSTIDESSFSGLLTLVEIGHIRIRLAGNGRINRIGLLAEPPGVSLGARMTGIRSTSSLQSVVMIAKVRIHSPEASGRFIGLLWGEMLRKKKVPIDRARWRPTFVASTTAAIEALHTAALLCCT
jgi:hypothetical protein